MSSDLLVQDLAQPLGIYSSSCPAEQPELGAGLLDNGNQRIHSLIEGGIMQCADASSELDDPVRNNSAASEALLMDSKANSVARAEGRGGRACEVPMARSKPNAPLPFVRDASNHQGYVSPQAPGAERVNPSNAHRIPDQVKRTMKSCASNPWHIIYSNPDGSCITQTNGRINATTNMADITARCDAVLVLCYAPCHDSARQTVQHILNLEQELPPVIVVMMDQQDSPHGNRMLQDQEEFLSSGADDVILVNEESTASAIAMSLNRIKRQYDIIHGLEELEQKVCAQEKYIRMLQTRHNRLFFTCTHMLFPDLPEMQANIIGPPAKGKTIDTLTIDSQIGQGSFGRVWGATDTSGKTRAVKSIPKQCLYEVEDVAGIANEIRLLSKVHGHENVVGFYGALHTQQFFYIIMEHVGESNLFRKIKSAGALSESLVQHYASQLVDALAFCIGRNVAHRDLKPENIGLGQDDQTVKLLDFGCSTSLRPGRLQRGPCGTMPFMAPEVMCGGNYDAAFVDVWAWGVLVLEMKCGVGKLSDLLNWPRKAKPSKEYADNLAHLFSKPESLFMQMVPDLGEDFIQVLYGALVVDPARRWPISKVKGSRWKNP